ncbi:MAG: helical backbone metal receptor [Ferruginibacter sp.]
MLLPSPVTGAQPARRIVSLVPSVTELLAYFDLDKETIGITKFCVHPAKWFRNKTRIGGTKDFNIEKIVALRPDLVLCNKEENSREPVEILAATLPVYLSDVSTVEDALNMIRDIGALTGKVPEAHALIEKIITAFGTISPGSPPIRTAYLIWKDPYMTAGGDTFISDMMAKAGFENIFENSMRYPTVSLQELAELAPQLVLLSSEPFPFKEKHVAELQIALPGTDLRLADGEMFSWYGSRMALAPDHFLALRRQIQSP